MHNKSLSKGHVKDSTGEPVIGANVVVKDNSSIGTITDLNGNFVLSVPQNSTLVISFIGYKPVEMKAAPSVTVTLHEDADASGSGGDWLWYREEK